MSKYICPRCGNEMEVDGGYGLCHHCVEQNMMCGVIEVRHDPRMTFAAYRAGDDDGKDVPMFVIYREPIDFPGVPFVVRRWAILRGRALPDPDDAMPCGTLEHARVYVISRLPGAVRFPREPDDDPVIVESWL